MKKYYVLLFILLIHFGLPAQNIPKKDAPKINWAISSQALPCLFGIANADLYFRASDRIAVSLPIVLGYLYPLTAVSRAHAWGALSGIGFRWSINSPLFTNGWFLDSQVKLGFVQLEGSYRGLIIIPSVGAGYAWHFKNGFSMSLGLNANLLITPQGFENSKRSLPFNFPVPLINYSIGYAF